MHQPAQPLPDLPYGQLLSHLATRPDSRWWLAQHS